MVWWRYFWAIKLSFVVDILAGLFWIGDGLGYFLKNWAIFFQIFWSPCVRVNGGSADIELRIVQHIIWIGSVEKVSQFILPPNSIYNKSFCFLNNKMHFSRLQKGKWLKNIFSHSMFCFTEIFGLTFQSCPLQPILFYKKRCCFLFCAFPLCISLLLLVPKDNEY